MRHLDESTIHAWLDGALDSADAARVAEHAASCAECGARVAEARGLIAGTSRLLATLDVVPGGVLPGGALPDDAARLAALKARLAEGAASPAPVARPVPRPRRWFAGRPMLAAASLLIVAVGTTLVLRERGGERFASAPMPGSGPPRVDTARQIASAPTLTSSLAAPAPQPTRTPAAERSARVATVDRATATTKQESAPAAMPRRSIASAAPTVAAAPPPADSASRDQRLSDVAVAPSRARATGAGAAGAVAMAPTTTSPPASAPTAQKTAAEAPSVASSNASPRAAMEARRRPEMMPPRPVLLGDFAGCYEVVSGELPGLAPRFTLDTTRLVADALAPELAVRAPDARDARWSTTGPVATVRWTAPAGAASGTWTLELRAALATQLQGSVVAPGATRPDGARSVTLRRCPTSR